MKRAEGIVEILEAFDLTGSYRAAAELAGCSHHTVARYVRLRAAGRVLTERAAKDRLIDGYLAKVEEWVERSHGRVRADIVHDKLLALGFGGSERTTRRAVAVAKRAYDAGHRRVYRPWIPEPGMWLQFDWGQGPRIDGRETLLWCAWLAWSRFRVVIPTWDRTLPTVVACLDETLRRFGGSPTYALTDNERTVTIDRIAGIGVRHPEIVAAGRHYGLQITACVPFDPESKGGSEATVRIAKADLVPTEANLLAAYGTFAQLRAACDAFCEAVNARTHRETREAPADRLAAERVRLHPIPAEAHTVAFGVTRVVDDDATLRFGSARYSVPHQLAGERVWVRVDGEELVVTFAARDGAREVARHALTTPGNPRIDPSHYPARTSDPLHPKPKPASPEEAAFLALGSGAERWLVLAAASGTERIRTKLRRATELAMLVGSDQVNRALGLAAEAGRFADGDLESIVDHLRLLGETRRERLEPADDTLQPGTSAWERVGAGQRR
ncbi:MAG TPA: IS21 family transposase [Candidatus Limnocylindrales bacterium]